LHLDPAAAAADVRHDLVPAARPAVADNIRACFRDSEKEIGNALVVSTQPQQSIAQQVPHDRHAHCLTRKNQAELHVHD
jgi:hypothetical protein